MARLKSLLWTTDGIGDGVVDGYPQDDVLRWQRILWLADPTTMGVAKNFPGELEVTNPAGRTLQVNTGGCLVYGFPGWLLAACNHTLTLPTAETGWRLVVRVDWATKEMTSELLESADGVAAIPDVTQTDGVRWEISLAYGTITAVPVVTVTDSRAYLSTAGKLTGDQFADSALDSVETANRTRRFWVSVVDVVTGGADPASPLTFADGVTTAGYGAFVVPTDYVSDMTVTPVIWVMAAGGPGAFWLNGDAYHCRAGQAWNTHTATFAAAAVPETPELTFGYVSAMALANAAIDDAVELEFTRTGAAGGDTSTADFLLVGWSVAYTADS